MRCYASIGDARRAFEPFASLEPELWTLWDLCRRVAPPARQAELRDDAYDVDPFEIDPLAAGKPDDGWCAEDYFLYEVKSRLLILVGIHRRRGPHELQTSVAYDTVYHILLNWALARPCACCAEDADDGSWHRDDEDDRRAHW